MKKLKLQVLSLNDCTKLTDAAVESLKEMTALTQLYVRGTKLGSKAIEELKKKDDLAVAAD